MNSTSLTIPQALQQAVHFFLFDKFAEAEELCNKILAVEPANTASRHILNGCARKKIATILAQRRQQRLLGKVAVITGAASGIGRATAEFFANEGAKVVLTDVQEVAGKELETKINSSGGQAVFVQGDVSSDSSVENIHTQALQAFGQIHILVNNAGILYYGNVVDQTPDEWHRLIDVNLGSVYRCCHTMAQSIIRSKGGSIINMASTQGLQGYPQSTGYAASKGGVLSLTRQMARDLSPCGIRVNSISPGVVMTPIFAKDSIGIDIDWVVAHSPIGYLGIPEDIASACVFLCSDDATFITGANLVIDGGMSMRGD